MCPIWVVCHLGFFPPPNAVSRTVQYPALWLWHNGKKQSEWSFITHHLLCWVLPKCSKCYSLVICDFCLLIHRSESSAYFYEMLLHCSPLTEGNQSEAGVLMACPEMFDRFGFLHLEPSHIGRAANIYSPPTNPEKITWSLEWHSTNVYIPAHV